MKPEQKADWRSKCWVTWHSVGFGCRGYFCFHPEYAAPVGVVFVVGTGGATPKADVMWSYVPPWFRRRGVRTLINEQLLKHYRVVTTGGGSKTGGLAFLKASGYVHDAVRGDWYLMKQSPAKAAAKAKVKRGKQ